jgi:hypothetical protein
MHKHGNKLIDKPITKEQGQQFSPVDPVAELIQLGL